MAVDEMVQQPRAGEAALPSAVGLRSNRQDAWRRLKRNRLAMVGAGIVGALLVMAAFAPWLMPYDPTLQHLELKRQAPSAVYWLGTDEFGRDILSRIILGSRFTLLVSCLAVLVSLVFGGGIGLVAGYVGGWFDEIAMRVMEIILAFPYLLLAIAIVAALGFGEQNTIIAIGIWAAPAFARMVRGQVLSQREREFVLSARAVGASEARILLLHILPNIVAPVLVFTTLYMANAILLEAALSFLGFGVQPPWPSWGLMVATGREFLLIAPHIATIPGLAIMLVVLGFNLLGDGLRDALDPRMRNRI